MSTTSEGIGSTTAAGSFDVALEDGASVQVWVYPRLARGETVTAYSYDSSDTVETEVFENGAVIELNDVHSRIMLNGPGNFRFKKSATATATTVYYDV